VQRLIEFAYAEGGAPDNVACVIADIITV